MSLSLEKIERHFDGKRRRSRRWLKNQKARKIRRVKTTEVPNIKHEGWEY
ncbi:MAG: hypothetical protein ABIP51_04090 [Bacteroidia bacterium]